MANKMELRRLNRNHVYRCIYESDGISRQEIAQQTGLSIPTILQNLNELEDQGLIQSDGVFESTGGRRAKVIRCNYDAKLAIGIDMTENHVTIAVVNLAGRIMLGGTRDALTFEDTDEFYDRIAGKMADLVHKGGIRPENILGVGISLPAIINYDTNEVVYSKVVPAPRNLYDKFASRIPYHIEIINDANAAGTAEAWRADTDQTSFYIMLSNTVGGALNVHTDAGDISRTMAYLGDNFCGGEIGHMRIVPEGRQCYCGQKGCMNRYCSAKCLSDLTGGRLEDFFERLDAGDETMQAAFDEYLKYLAYSVINIRMLYDCDIILGGYVGAYMEKYMDRFRERVAALDIYSPNADYVKSCRYRTEASAVGAALGYLSRFTAEI